MLRGNRAFKKGGKSVFCQGRKTKKIGEFPKNSIHHGKGAPKEEKEEEETAQRN